MKSQLFVLFISISLLPPLFPLSLNDNDPSLASFAPGRLDLFVKGTNNHLFQKTFQNGIWQSDWTDLGGDIVSSPSACSRGPDQYDVFARGPDNKLHHANYKSGAWSWEILEANIISAPAAVSRGYNRIDVFALNTNKALIHQFFDGNSWSGIPFLFRFINKLINH